MISFSESKEYVDRTKTTPPLAGFLTWYDNSVQFQCGQGPGTSTFASIPSTPHYDVVLWSGSDQPMEALWRVHVGDQSTDYARNLLAGHFNIFWNFHFGSAVPTSFTFSSNADSQNLYWTSVVYDEPHSETRSPYTDDIVSQAVPGNLTLGS